MVYHSRCALYANTLWQFGACQRLANAIMADIGNLAKPVEQTERLQYGGINADADVRVAGFNFLKRRSGGKRALRHDRHGQPPAAAGIMDVRAQLA